MNPINPWVAFALGMCLLALPMSLRAQPSTPPDRFNLETCIQYALEHNQRLQNMRFDEYIAQKEVESIIRQGFPQIDVNADLTYNFQLPIFVIPGQSGELNEVTFGLPWQTTAGASLTQLIFDGRYFLGIQASRTFVELAEKQSQQSREEVAYQVSKAYFTTLVSQEQLNLLEANIERVQELFTETQAMYDEGFVEKIDVDRLEINLNNLRSERENAQRLTALSVDMLKFQMGMPVQDTLLLAGLVDNIQPQLPTLDPMASFNYQDRAEYQALKVSRELEAYNTKQYKVGYLPALYGFANYSWNRLWDGPEAFSYEAGALGLRLSWSLFDGGQRNKEIQKSQLAIKKIENQMNEFENAATLEVKQTYAQLTNAYQSWDAQLRNKELAERVYDISRIKYQEGVGSSLEVNDAESQLKSAESNYLNRLYDYLMASVELEKARGQFARYQ